MNAYLIVRRLVPHARMPYRATLGSAGYDLSASENVTIPPHSTALVPTGLALEIPALHYGRVAPRSSVALNNLIVNAGVIDCDYRGEVQVMIFNANSSTVILERGQRIAQLILERISWLDVREVIELDATERDTKGFGSTGV